jgi:glutathione peroxidase
MKASVTPFLAALLCIAFTARAQSPDSTSLHQFSIAKANGGVISFSAYSGKKVLLVNTASLANDKLQISRLQTLQQNNAAQLVVVALPCADFNNLEPEDSTRLIYNHYQQAFGVSYPVTAKVHVTGPAIHPLCQFMTRKEKNGVMNSAVKNNFYKYLFDGAGHLIGVFNETVDPLSAVIQQAVDDN